MLDLALLGCCLVSLHSMCDILNTSPDHSLPEGILAYCDGSGIFAYALIIPLHPSLHSSLSNHPEKVFVSGLRSSERVLLYSVFHQNVYILQDVTMKLDEQHFILCCVLASLPTCMQTLRQQYNINNKCCSPN